MNNQLELTNPQNVFSGAPGMNRTCDTRIRNPVLYPLSYGGVVVGMSGASSAADGPEVTYSTVRGRCQSIHGSISHILIAGSIASCACSQHYQAAPTTPLSWFV